MDIVIAVPADEASDRQILLAILEMQQELLARLEGMEQNVADVNASLAALTGAVDDIGTRFTNANRDLQTALADKAVAEQRMNEALANDATDAATIADLRAQLDAATTKIDQAAGAIDNEVRRLNQLGTPTGTQPDDGTHPNPDQGTGTEDGTGTPQEPVQDTGDTTPAPEGGDVPSEPSTEPVPEQ